MTKIHIVAVGKDKQHWVTEGAAHYLKLLQRFALMELTVLPSPASMSSMTTEQIQKKEATLFSTHLLSGFTVALSDRGQSMNSIQFAKAFDRWQTDSGSRICFLIGGPYGLHNSILEKSNAVASLSSLTFSHQIVRLVLLEQLYRGYSILHNTEYHK